MGTVAFSTTPPYRIAMHYAEILPTDYHFLTTKFGKFKGGRVNLWCKKEKIDVRKSRFERIIDKKNLVTHIFIAMKNIILSLVALTFVAC